VAIVGEYGTGKTHLALSILKTVLLNDPGSTKSFYMDAPADTFLALYRDRFIPRLRKREIRDQVEAYLADILAERLLRNKVTAPAAEALTSGSTRPLEAMASLGLIESDLMQDLRKRLKAVTEREDYATAFTLFLRPEFEDAVWEWLCGNPPDPSLHERGITAGIDTEPAALEAIGVFAFLFGRKGRRFVLLIDEMEKVLTPASGRHVDEATMLAFKKLMEAVAHTRSLLVVIGLPDFLEVLHEDVRQRFTTIIQPSPMTGDEIAEFVRTAQKAHTGKAELKPFSGDSIQYIADITGGNARRVVRLCYLAYQHAAASGARVTRATLREVARDQFATGTQRDAAAEITRILDSTGWTYERDATSSAGSVDVQSFWLPVGSGELGILVVLSRSVLHDTEASAIQRQVTNRVGSNDSEAVKAVLVVNGYLAQNLAAKVRQVFQRVLIFSSHDFREDFEAVARGYRQQLEAASREDVLTHLSERMEQVARQMTFLVDSFDTWERSSSTRNLPTSIESAIRRVFRTLGSPTGPVLGYEAAFARIAVVENDLLRVRTDLSGDEEVLQYQHAQLLLTRFRDDLTGVLSNPTPERSLVNQVGELCSSFDTSIKDIVVDKGRRGPTYIISVLSELPYMVYQSVREILDRKAESPLS
jgi:Cdc6-like AAA superfamily ATPase